MNESIYLARDVIKTHITAIDAFQALNSGKAGQVYLGQVEYFSDSKYKHTLATPFNINNFPVLPKVIIIFQYVDVDITLLFCLLQDKAIRGIVFACTGNGSIPSYQEEFVQQAINQGIIIVRSSRVPAGTIQNDHNTIDQCFGTIPANNLTPQKARILLMLALTITSDPTTIREYFTLY